MSNEITQNSPALMERVEKALDSIRPYLIADGGNVEVMQITEEQVLEIKLIGACGSCPMSTMTLKAGVEQTVLSAVPEIVAVKAVESGS